MTTMMDRGTMGMPGMGTGMAPMGGTAAPMMPNMMMVPRGTMKFEKCPGGMRVTCSCDDPMAASMVQNLCSMMAGGMVSCCMVMNGMMVCCCNLTLGMCRCETTDKAVALTCTSGDAKCGEMIQACCDYLASMMRAGCTCCLMINNNPVCCGSA